MTYKTTSENTHRLTRKGSHSTKGSPRGYSDVLPPNAKDEEEELISFYEKVKLISESLIRSRFLISISPKYSEQYSENLGVMRDLEDQIGNARRCLEIVKHKHRGLLFYRIARVFLSHEIFSHIDQEVSKLIKEQPLSIQQAYQEKTKTNKNKRKKSSSCGDPFCDKQKDRLRQTTIIQSNKIQRLISVINAYKKQTGIERVSI